MLLLVSHFIQQLKGQISHTFHSNVKSDVTSNSMFFTVKSGDALHRIAAGITNDLHTP